MSGHQMAIYLHDHLSGSIGGLNLLERLAESWPDDENGVVLRAMQNEFKEEREQLEKLAAHFPLATALPRRAVGWVAEKGLELKLRVDSLGDDTFRRFEGLEALSVGIAGKRLLWRMLAKKAESDPQLAGPAYTKLTNQAVRQRKRIEALRLGLASDLN